MRYKIFSFTIMLILTLLATPVFATPTSMPSVPSKTEVVFSEPIINNNDILFERAIKGKSDLEKELILPSGKIINQESKIEKAVKTYTTTQHYKTTKDANGKITKSYVTTSFAVIPEAQLEKDSNLTIQSYDASLYNSGWDSTYGIKAYSTIYWNWDYDAAGITYIDMSNQTINGG